MVFRNSIIPLSWWLFPRVVGASRFPYETPLEHSLSTLSRSPEIIFYKLDYFKLILPT